ncbi:phosphotransferase enzyme family protein [Saccharibacillus sacchari]|uniref:phosphotransferase enzyme family protein n=1 Tax=Saccharibacillus sacchari TaxID=456493 RepID=UPI0004B8198C|nr:phosphotransferase [Saccharibacillus sacchari]
MNLSKSQFEHVKNDEEPIASRSVFRSAYVERRLSGLYDLGKWTECRYWLRGLNDTYRVRAQDGGAYMLRIYRAEVRESDIAFELELLERLQAELLGTAAEASPAVRLADGRLFSALPAPEGVRFAALFREAEGAEDAMQDEASCIAFGRSAAELHAAMDRVSPRTAGGFGAVRGIGRAAEGAADAAASEPPERATRAVSGEARAAKPLPPRAPADAEVLLRAPLRMILAQIGEDHPEAPFLRGYAQGLEAAASEAVSGGLDFGLCHGDMHGNNNALRQGDRFTHFDFEFAAPGWRAWDLAQVKNRKRQQSERIEPLWQAFLEGYRSIRPFSAVDEAAVEIFRLVRRFWTMGLDAEIAPLCDGALDFGEDWLAEFAEEFRRHPLGEVANTTL